jgi:hypothetical protein
MKSVLFLLCISSILNANPQVGSDSSVDLKATAEYTNYELNLVSPEPMNYELPPSRASNLPLEGIAVNDHHHTPQNILTAETENSGENRQFLDAPVAAQSKGREIIFSIKNRASLKAKVSIEIPPKYLALNDVSLKNEAYHEFIPEDENPLLWSKIITIWRTPTDGKLPQLLEILEKQYKSRGDKCAHSLDEENGFKTSFLTAEYSAIYPDGTKIFGKKEILMTKVIEESEGFVIIQISARYKTNSSQETIASIKEQMLAFLNSCVISKIASKDSPDGSHSLLGTSQTVNSDLSINDASKKDEYTTIQELRENRNKFIDLKCPQLKSTGLRKVDIPKNEQTNSNETGTRWTWGD